MMTTFTMDPKPQLLSKPEVKNEQQRSRLAQEELKKRGYDPDEITGIVDAMDDIEEIRDDNEE